MTKLATLHALRLRNAVMAPALAAKLSATAGDRALLAAVEFPAGDIPWHGTLMFTDVDTSDFRSFPFAGGSARSLPLPLQANLETTEWGHVGAINVGRIETFDLIDGACTATGMLNDPASSDHCFAVAYALAVGNVRGVSVDLGVSEVEWDPIVWDDDGYPAEFRMVATAWELMGATITPFPAFSGAFIALDIPGAMQEPPTQTSPIVVVPAPELVASVAGAADLALAGTDVAWDEATAVADVLTFATDDAGVIDEALYGTAFAWHDDTMDGTDGCRLPFATIVDDELVAIPDGVTAAGDALFAGVDGMDDTDAEAAEALLEGYYTQLGIDPPWMDAPEEIVEDDGGDGPPALFASASTKTAPLAVSFPLHPLTSWFNDPQLAAPTAPRYLGTGRAYGHLALWDVCHIGFSEECICAPSSMLDYALFHTGYVVTADGDEVQCGNLTIGTGHASRYASAAAAAAHYDNTGTAFADVRVGEDEHGIWFAGALRRTLTDDQVREAQASAISGDWRDVHGNLEMVAALAVNVPAFPVAKALVASGHAPVPGLEPRLTVRQGRRISLLASGGVAPLARVISRRNMTATLAEVDDVTAVVAAQGARIAKLEAHIRNLDVTARQAAQRRIDPT